MSDLADKHVLVVDDSAMIRKILRKLLTEHGITQITECENGETARAALQASSFSIILCDLNMPDITGMEVLQFCRMNPSSEATPFVMITSELSAEVVSEAQGLGVTDFIGKPFSKPVFERKVLGLL